MPEELKNNENKEMSLRKNETNPYEMLNIMSPIIQPLMDTIMKPQLKQIEENARLAHKNLEYQHAHFKLIFGFVFFICAIILFITLYLIIYNHNIAEGLAVLSYAGTVALGFIGGYGYAKKS